MEMEIKVTVQCPLCGHPNDRTIKALEQLRPIICGGCQVSIKIPWSRPLSQPQ